MEETDVCHSILEFRALQQGIPNGCTAKYLPPSERQRIGLQALAGNQSITALADELDVSRQFIYRQRSTAEQALSEAFAAQPDDEKVLFNLPVTKQWLRQLTLGLVLSCHSPLRGVVQLLHDVFDYNISLGTVCNTVEAAVMPARQHNQAQNLSQVRVGGHDEIFQAGRPVLVGVDLLTTYCYLLSIEESRDTDTWTVHCLDLQERGFDPDYVVADAAPALRAGLAAVWPAVTCRSDLFHALQEVGEVVRSLEKRAFDIMTTCADLERKIARAKQQGRRPDPSCVKRLSIATQEQARAMALADDVALLARWLHYDVLDLAGPTHADRQVLFDFLGDELTARIPHAPSCLGKLATYLKGQRDDLLAFAAELDGDFEALAAEFAVAPELVRELFAVQTLKLDNPRRWRLDAPLRRLLGASYFPLSQALDDVQRRTVRASSLVENYNSRLRSYFFLRRHLGNDYLALLQFFLNHRRYPRSTKAERVGKSPAELLTGQSHPHWLEMLGFQRFSRN